MKTLLARFAKQSDGSTSVTSKHFKRKHHKTESESHLLRQDISFKANKHNKITNKTEVYIL